MKEPIISYVFVGILLIVFVASMVIISSLTAITVLEQTTCLMR